MIKRVKEDKERAEASYNAVITGSKSVKATYEIKFAEISKYLAQLTDDRNEDKDRINQLNAIIVSQRDERAKMTDIKEQMESEHKLHVEQIAALVDGFKDKLALNDKIAGQKLSETVSLVNELKRTHCALTRSED